MSAIKDISLRERWRAIVLLTRMDKPIGTYLLLWPTYWALWVASDGLPNAHHFIVFTLGVFLMRSAGCVINDYADRHVDGKVKRTKHRPIVSGLISPKGALALFFVLIACAFLLVLTLTTYTIMLSVVALLLAACYPFMKRYTHFPQVVLGLAFSWGMIMAFAEARGEVPLVAWLLFLANICWTVAYDTQYAMVDRDDDLKIGVKSTAVLFGRFDKRIILMLQLTTLALLLAVGELQAFGWPFQLALVICAALFTYQQILIVNRDRQRCFQAFLHNHFIGLVVFIAIVIEFA